MHRDTVFVLGAGFTKAFLPEAPLMVDDYDSDGYLSERVKGTRYAGRLLAAEKQRAGGKINIERLMTRLDSEMPYDSRETDASELKYFLFEVKRAFFRKLHKAEQDLQHLPVLVDFAAECIKWRATCITFNYDDAFDWALAYATHSRKGLDQGWSLYDGYGFNCRTILPGTVSEYGPGSWSNMNLLKLHGSTNWKVKLGKTSPIGPEDVVTMQSWASGNSTVEKWMAPSSSDYLEILPLEPFPYMVPPVLTKSAITKDILLKVIWIKARSVLEQAKRVVFIGYSLPSTDIAARFLFSEAIKEGTVIDVVVKLPKDNPDKEKARIEDSYNTLFWAKTPRFVWGDARPWLAEEIRPKSS